jgi:hypothetical protein
LDPLCQKRKAAGGPAAVSPLSIKRAFCRVKFVATRSASDEFFRGNDADESDRRMDRRFRDTLTFEQLLAELSDLGKSRY